MANSADPDQMPHLGCLIRVYTVCSDLSVTIFRVITIFFFHYFSENKARQAIHVKSEMLNILDLEKKKNLFQIKCHLLHLQQALKGLLFLFFFLV